MDESTERRSAPTIQWRSKYVRLLEDIFDLNLNTFEGSKLPVGINSVTGILCLGSEVALFLFNPIRELSADKESHWPGSSQCWNRERDYVFFSVHPTSELITCHVYFVTDKILVAHHFSVIIFWACQLFGQPHIQKFTQIHISTHSCSFSSSTEGLVSWCPLCPAGLNCCWTRAQCQRPRPWALQCT